MDEQIKMVLKVIQYFPTYLLNSYVLYRYRNYELVTYRTYIYVPTV